jgi:hypothetical protein
VTVYEPYIGPYYEDFGIGDIYKHWPGRTISEADNTWFTLLTMNKHPVHFDHYFGQTPGVRRRKAARIRHRIDNPIKRSGYKYADNQFFTVIDPGANKIKTQETTKIVSFFRVEGIISNISETNIMKSVSCNLNALFWLFNIGLFMHLVSNC